MPLPLARYKIFLKNQAGVRVAEFDDWVRMEYGVKVGDIGYYRLELTATDPRIQLFAVDGQVEVYRADKPNQLNWYLDFEGLHRQEIRKVDAKGRQVYSSIGVGYNDLLARRIIGYKAGTVRSDKNAAAETVMKEYVDENCGPVATIANGRLSTGAMPGFFVDTDQGNGVEWSGSRAFELVLDVLKEISNYSGIDYAVVGTGPATYEFRTYVGQLGQDRTTLGLDARNGKNTAGNYPVVFSVSAGTIQEFSYTSNHLNEVNVIYVLGQGTASTRTVIVRQNIAAIATSPLNRREVSRPASKNEFLYQLNAFGDETLESLKAAEEVTFVPMQQSSTIYGRNFDVGDRVTFKHDTVQIHKRIVSKKVVIEKGKNEEITLEFADIP